MTDKTPLRQLYDAVTKANGWSSRDIEKRIEDRGMKLSKSRIGQLVNTWPLDSVTASAVHALALGLGVAPERVAVAAIQSMGFRVQADQVTPAEAIMRDESLSDDVRRSLLAILSAANGGRRGAVG